ncbi:hypothetical protein GR212_17210 [Rhizobium lusitanum]|uniref:Tip attachment protein J domain-containing protein n=1 Tax=Rhizobium lusitanum TaxID=293958 RepID=A0A6L9U7J2_9HYPH|nr:hypothetical protein [Rhizobium lusitanum]NEI71319.1 hypothetical protein [Rhizobium lusitanum]
MKYLILLLNVLGFWLMADVAHAEPISLAIAAISQFVSSIGIIGKLVLTVAINIGLSLVEKALAKKDQPQPAGTKLEISMGDDHAMSFIIGSYATAGKRKYAGTWGDDGKTPNAYFTDVIEIGSLPNRAGERGLTSVWIDDQKVGVLWEEPHPDGRGFPVLQYRANGKDYLWIKFLDGTQTSPDPFLIAKFGSHAERPWKPTMIGRGCQVVVLTSRYNTDLFSGVPSGLFEPHPLPLYDVRKDSSVGGNGAQRWADPSTWQPSTNPAVMIYNLARGVYYGSEWVYGGQNIGAFCLPATNWMAAANACNASVQLGDGTSEPAFRAGYDVQCDQEPLDAVSELLKGCNGRMAEVGGIFKMLVGTPGAAVYSFSDDDIVVTEEQSFQPFPSLSATYNAIEVTYPEPAEKWATKDAPGRYNADLEVQDGNRRLPAQIQLLAVPFANQVQRVGLAMIQDYRRFRVHQVSLPPDAYPLEPNDVVSWSSVRNGYDEKKFLVVKVEPQPNFLIVVTLKEVDPADYDWHPDMQLPTAIGWLGPITPPSQPMIGWTVEPATIKDSGGIDRRPAIKISCAPDLDDVRGVWVQVRLKDTGDVVFDSDSNPYASPYSWVLSGQWTLANTNYEARGRYLARSHRATDWSAWLTVKTPNVLIQAGDVLDGAIIASKIADAAVTAAKIMDDAVTNLKLADQAVSTAKLEVAAVTADVLASGAVISAKLADGAVTATKLAQGAVDATSLASSIKAVEIVSALPATANVEGRQVYLTTDGKLYRYHNGAWTATVASVDINGTLTDAQIDAVAATKVTGTLVSSQIADAAITSAKVAAAAIDATKFASGIRPVEIVSSLPTTGNSEGRTVYLTADDKLYRYTGSAWISTTAAADVTGQMTDAQIAAVAAAKVTGALVSSQIADAAITTAKFASGIRPVEIVATLPTTGNVEGRMVYLTTDDKLYRYTGSAWTSATPSTDITGQLTDAQIAAVAAAKVTGTLVSSQIADAAITNSKLAALAVDATKLADASVTAAKIADAAVSTTKFASGIRPIEIVAALPTTGNVEGRTVYLTTDDKLYRYTGAAWTSATPATDITGQLTDAQIGAIAAAKVTGQITSTQITDGAISTPKLAAGAVTANELAANSVIAAKIAAGAVVAAAISAGAVTTNAIAAGAVTATQIATNTITAGQISAGAIGATQIAAGAVTTAKLSAGAVTANELAANAVTAGKIAANAVAATNIAAGAVTAKSLLLQDFENLVPNGRWEDTATVLSAYWAFSGTGSVSLVSDPATALTGANYMRLSKAAAGATSVNVQMIDYMPVVAGESLYCETAWRSDAAATAGFYFRVGWYDGNKVALASPQYIDVRGNVAMATDWTIYSTKIAIPAGADFCRVQFYNHNTQTTALYVDIDRVVLRRANAASLIVDGGITANSLAANSVTTVALAAGAVTANEIAANAITTGKIAAGSVTAAQIAANTITAGQIAAGAIGATQIAANTITADKMVLADFTNRCENPNFGEGNGSWTITAASSIVNDPASAYVGICYLNVGAGINGIVSRNINIFPVIAGEQYFLQAFAKVTGAPNVAISLRIRYTQADKSTLVGTGAVTIPANGAATYAEYNVSSSVPAGAVYAWVDFATNSSAITTGSYQIGFVSCQRRNAGSLIVDGAIAAAKIAANAVTAASIAAGAITTDALAANAVTTAKIAAGAVTATQIAANTITAGQIAAGAISVTQLAAGAVTAKSLVIQDWENLIPDNQLQSAASWSSLNNSVINPATTQAFTSKGSLDYTYVAGASYVQILTSQPFAVVSGQEYFASAQAIRTSGSKFGLWLRVYWLDANGNLLNPDTYLTITSYGTAGGGTIDGVQSFSASIIPPSSAYGAVLKGYIHRDYTDGNVSIGGFSFLRKATANLIVDGTITANKMVLGDFTNRVENPNFGEGDVGWVKAAGVTIVNDSANAYVGNYYANIPIGAAGVFLASDNIFPVVPGEQYLLQVVAKATDAPSAGIYGRVHFLAADKTTNIGTPNVVIPTTVGMSYTEYRVSATAPANAVYARIDFNPVAAFTGGSYQIGFVSCQRKGTGSLVVDGTITGTNIAATTITAGNIAAGTLTAAQIAASAITATQLAAGAVTTAKLAAGAVTANELAASAVTAGTIAAGAVSASQIAAGAITTDKLASGSVTTDALAAGAVTATDIASNAVTADKIAANAVTAGKIAANAVTAGTISAGAVTATTIAGGTITGDKLAANTIGADQIAANAITAKQLVLTDFSNMADNGWQTGTLDGWTTQNVQSFANDATAGDAAGYVLQSLGRDCARSNFVAVTPGDVYAFDVWVKNADANMAQVTAITMTPSGTVAYAAVTSTTTKNGWVRLQGRYTVASGVSKLAMLLQVVKTAGTGSSCYWSNPVMRRAVSAELIVDGSITANKMSVNSLDAITANLGAVNISSAVIGTLQVGTSNIQGGAVTAMTAGRNAGGQTISANQTVNLAAAGITVAGDGRVMINAMTIGQYNQNGGSQNAQPIGCNIFRDGTAIFSQTYYLGVVQTVVTSSGGGGGGGGVTQTTYTAGLVSVPALYDAPGAGYHVYTLQIYCPNNTIAWNESNIIATAFKR